MSEKPFVRNAADESQVKEAEKKVKRTREHELDDIRKVLDTPAGRRVLWRYLSMCGVFKLSFNHSGAITSLNEGKRDIGLNIMGDITEANDEALIKMMREAKGDND